MMDVARRDTNRVRTLICSEPSRKVTELIKELAALEPSIALSALVAITSATHICNVYNQRIQGILPGREDIEYVILSKKPRYQSQSHTTNYTHHRRVLDIARKRGAKRARAKVVPVAPRNTGDIIDGCAGDTQLIPLGKRESDAATTTAITNYTCLPIGDHLSKEEGLRVHNKMADENETPTFSHHINANVNSTKAAKFRRAKRMLNMASFDTPEDVRQSTGEAFAEDSVDRANEKGFTAFTLASAFGDIDCPEGGLTAGGMTETDHFTPVGVSTNTTKGCSPKSLSIMLDCPTPWLEEWVMSTPLTSGHNTIIDLMKSEPKDMAEAMLYIEDNLSRLDLSPIHRSVLSMRWTNYQLVLEDSLQKENSGHDPNSLNHPEKSRHTL